MSYSERSSLEFRIKLLREHAKGIKDDRIAGEIAKYLCILASGYLEVRIKEIVAHYVESRASSEIKRYVEKKLSYFQNPRPDRILELCGDFSPQMRDELKTQLSADLADAILSIVSHRNNLAHGADSSISLGRFEDYFSRTQKGVMKIEQVFGG